jgi:hypothetical protein
MNKRPDHHATLVPCKECARIKLMRRMEKSEKERAKWDALLDAHLGEKAQVAQPNLFGEIKVMG